MNKDWTGNKKSIYTPLGASNHIEEERAVNDYYATSGVAVEKLLRIETPYTKIWECAAGECHLASPLKLAGYDVYTTDIIERGVPLDDCIDFLTIKKSPIGKCDIITNPPYKYALEFILKGLDLLEEGRCMYMFLKLTFLEGKKRYKKLFEKYPPAIVYVSSERIVCAKNGDFRSIKESGGSAVAYGWFKWIKGYKGDTQIKWI